MFLTMVFLLHVLCIAILIRNEIATLHFIRTYCVLSLLYEGETYTVMIIINWMLHATMLYAGFLVVAGVKVIYVLTDHCKILFWKKALNNNNHFTALCPGLPGWAGTRRNFHPPTTLIIIQSLSASSIYYDPQHPPCSNYVLGNLFAQPLSTSTAKHRVKWRHSDLWSHYDLYVVRQHGVLCEVKRRRFVALFE